MPTNPLYDAWNIWLEQHLPRVRITCLRAAAVVAMGLYKSRSVHLSEIAAQVPGDAKLLSQERRVRRFLDNKGCCPRVWYEPIARWWLAWLINTQGEVVLIIDGSKVTAHHQLLMVAVALPKGRSLPIAWTWISTKRGHSSGSIQLALFDRVQRLLPPKARVTVVGDCEFGAVEVMQHFSTQWHWNYVLRQKSSNQVQVALDADWQNFDELVTQPNTMRFVPSALLTAKHAFRTALLAVWAKGEKDCWLLASSFNTADETMRYYRNRMSIEEMFGDFKRHGFDLEHSRLSSISRLDRLVLLVCLLYVWLIRTGLMLIIGERTSLVDRNDRRDLSLFKLGVRYIQRLLNNRQPIRVWLCPDNLFDLLLCDQVKLSGS